jgi:hypothetical protein
MPSVLLFIAAVLLRDESALRDAFAKDIKAKEAAKRVEAVGKLAGAKEEKTIELLAKSLKDPALEVRKAAAQALEGSTDGAGKAIKPLGDILVDKKEDLDLRLMCARALSKARYKSEAFPFFYTTISSIEREEREFHKFGADVTKILDGFAGKSFGADKTTAERWSEWWTDNQKALKEEDAKKHKEWKEKKE